MACSSKRMISLSRFALAGCGGQPLACPNCFCVKVVRPGRVKKGQRAGPRVVKTTPVFTQYKCERGRNHQGELVGCQHKFVVLRAEARKEAELVAGASAAALEPQKTQVSDAEQATKSRNGSEKAAVARFGPMGGLLETHSLSITAFNTDEAGAHHGAEPKSELAADEGDSAGAKRAKLDGASSDLDAEVEMQDVHAAALSDESQRRWWLHVTSACNRADLLAPKRPNGEFCDESRAEPTSSDELAEQPPSGAPMSFTERMLKTRAACADKKVRGIARVKMLGPHGSSSALDTLATVDAEPAAYRELWPSSGTDLPLKRPLDDEQPPPPLEEPLQPDAVACRPSAFARPREMALRRGRPMRWDLHSAPIGVRLLTVSVGCANHRPSPGPSMYVHKGFPANAYGRPNLHGCHARARQG